MTPPNKNPRQTEKIDASLYRHLVGGVTDHSCTRYMHYSMAFPLTVLVFLILEIIDPNFRLMKNFLDFLDYKEIVGEEGRGIG